MKRISLVIALLTFLSARAWALSCPSNVTTISPTDTSCWPMQETTGTTITDTTDSNSGTISGSYTLNQYPGGIACNGNGNGGCNITTPTNYASPQPMSFYIDFVGTSGGIAQLGTSSSLSATPYYVLFLDNHGKLTFGVNNFTTYQTIQSPLPYADGNEHKAVVSLGASGAKLYVDGSLVASSGLTLASYANGYWFFGGVNPAGWQLGPTNGNLNGTLITAAWWNGHQLTDQQGVSLTGGNPAAITNNYCTFSNQIASLNPATSQAFANKKITFSTNGSYGGNTLQVPGIGSTLPIGPSTIVCQTDSSGNILSGCQIPQGAHVLLQVGSGPNIPIVIPASTSCDLTSILLSESDPPEVVSAVATAGPLFAGVTVTNPPAGTIGTATITAPAAFSQTQTSAATVDIGVDGNNQQVIMGGSVAVSLTDFASGANFSIDTTEGGSGGYSPTFSVPGGWTLVWSGGGSQPAMPATTLGFHVLWNFQAISSSVLVGNLQGSGSGTFPLSSTANANYYSIVNLNQLVLTPPPGLTPSVTATCSGTCTTTYTYEVTCVGDNSTESSPSGAVTATNAATLSISKYNSFSSTTSSACKGGYNVYGRVSGALGLLANVTSFPYIDNGTASPGAAPPTLGTWGMIVKGSGYLGIPEMAMGGVADNGLTTSQYWPFQGVLPSTDETGETLVAQPAPVSGAIVNMFCQEGTATCSFDSSPVAIVQGDMLDTVTGSSNDAILTLRKNATNTAMTCTVSGSGGNSPSVYGRCSYEIIH
jgi:hypothetical protein